MRVARDRINDVPCANFAEFDGREVVIPALIIDRTASHVDMAFITRGAERSLRAIRH
jgi:hypothetical protein